MTYYTCLLTYNIAFHPLRKYPGPRLDAAIPWWQSISYLKGTRPQDLLDLHNRYGPVIRAAPNELSYISPTAWKDIYGYPEKSKEEFPKDKRYHAGFAASQSILTADRHDHRRLRKMLAPGFSNKAIRGQELILQQYVGFLFQKLYENSSGGTAPVDISKWFNVCPPHGHLV